MCAAFATVLAATAIALGTGAPIASAGAASPPVSDDFHSGSLNPSLWSVENPVGNGLASVVDRALVLALPAGGSDHDAWSPGKHQLRVMQPVRDANFEVEAKFETMGSNQFQDEGILIEQDAKNAIRFAVYSDGTTKWASASILAGPTASTRIAVPVADTAPSFWMRVKRTGATWTLSYSSDGVTYAGAGSFLAPMSVTRLGPYAGNAGNPGTTPPAWTAVVDYFFNTVTPIVPEDGARSYVPVANDDFSGEALDTSKWSFVNPGGRSEVRADGQHAVIAGPGVNSSDPSSSGDRAARIMQPATDGDMHVEAKFDSQSADVFQQQGIVFEEGANRYLHVGIAQDWFETSIVASSVSDGTPTTALQISIYNKGSIALRVERDGATWRVSYSYDELHWALAGTFTDNLTVANVGVFADNLSDVSSGFAAEVDYFVDVASPPATEDGAAWLTAPAVP